MDNSYLISFFAFVIIVICFVYCISCCVAVSDEINSSYHISSQSNETPPLTPLSD